MPKTGFRPQKDGFAFVNSWTFDIKENDRMVNGLTHSAGNVSSSMVGNLSSIADGVITPTIKRLVAGAAPQSYGLCGGMAAAALDYYAHGKRLPRGKDVHDLPTNETPDGAKLRSYLLNRQLESMAFNFPKLLAWMVMLHIDLPFIEDGPKWLLQQSKSEWQALKAHIDAGTPWPLMLIGSSASPFNNHQVLAYGYDEPENGTGTIYIYDMNCPDQENTLKLDFRQEMLVAEESCPQAPRGPLRGFFCDVYSRETPPDVEH